VINRTERERNLADAVGAERTSSHDHIRSTFLSTVEADLHKECLSIPATGSDTFIDFLRKADAGKAGGSVRKFGQAFAQDLEGEICDFFDLGERVTTNSGTFTVRELVRAWAFIVTIAVLGQRWNERHADVSDGDATKATQKSGDTERAIRDVPVAELRRAWLARMLAREAGFSLQKSNSLVEQFTSRSKIGRIDLFYKPLLLLSNHVVLQPTPYIRGSRFERNVFALIATETDLDQKRKGYLPVLGLEKEFKTAGFAALANFRVLINHREVTDIDLVAFKDGILFLGQCKIVIAPDSLYDTWKAEQKLEDAASQLNTCIAYLDEVRATLFERLGLKGTKEQRVVPFILTNVRQFTERRFRNHPVVDIPYLSFVLGGARGTIIGTSPSRIGIESGRSYIEGESPTGAELASLLVQTIHKVQHREIVYKHALRKIGDRKIHIPLMSMQTAGEGGLTVTRDEIFDDEQPLQPWQTSK